MKKYLFVILSIVIVILNPWLWKFTKEFINLPNYNFILSLLLAFFVGLLYLKLNGKIIQLLLIILIILPLSIELMWYISFKIHYANNDVHLDAFGSYPREMYRDFNSYFEFAYGNGNWKYRLNRLIIEIAIWLTLSTVFIFIKRTRISKY